LVSKHTHKPVNWTIFFVFALMIKIQFYLKFLQKKGEGDSFVSLTLFKVGEQLPLRLAQALMCHDFASL